jgi:hypothetical protein
MKIIHQAERQKQIVSEVENRFEGDYMLEYDKGETF